MDFSVNVPINSVSFGQSSIAILREMYKLGLNPNIFPIGGSVDLSTQKEDGDFNNWLINNIKKAHRSHKRNVPVLKLWHLNSSLESISNKQVLLTFLETDSPTPEEVNVVKNNYKVIFTNNYIKNIFTEENGCNNVVKIPLGFDSFNFKVLNKQYFTDGRISFNLLGKFELRKRHDRIIKAWVKKYGNNPKYFLNCALWNHFMSPEEQHQNYAQVLEGKRVGNVQFLGWMPNNSLYNDYLNSGDIVIGMSGAEGFDLGVFHSIALGKHGVVLNAHAYKEYATSKNSILVNPMGKEPCYDNRFFRQGDQWNQGNFYSFSEEDFLNSCDLAIKRVEENRVNIEGLKLQTEFTYEKTTKSILNCLEECVNT